MVEISVRGITPDGLALVYEVAGVELVTPAPHPDLPRIDVLGYIEEDGNETQWATAGTPADEPAVPFSIPENGIVAHVQVPAGAAPTDEHIQRLAAT